MKIKKTIFILFISFLIPLIPQALGQDHGNEDLNNLTKEELLKRHKKLLNSIKKNKKESTSPPSQNFNSPFDDPFFGDDMGISDMIRNMRKKFEGFLSNPQMDPFDNFGSMGLKRENGPQIKTREDDKNIFIEIDTKNIDKNSLSITIKDGHIKISGKSVIEKRKQGSGTQSISRSESNFSKTFPVPKEAKEDEAKIENSNQKIIISFPKKRPKQII